MQFQVNAAGKRVFPSEFKTKVLEELHRGAISHELGRTYGIGSQNIIRWKKLEQSAVLGRSYEPKAEETASEILYRSFHIRFIGCPIADRSSWRTCEDFRRIDHTSISGRQGAALTNSEKKRFQKALLETRGDRKEAVKLLNVSQPHSFVERRNSGPLHHAVSDYSFSKTRPS